MKGGAEIFRACGARNSEDGIGVDDQRSWVENVWWAGLDLPQPRLTSKKQTRAWGTRPGDGQGTLWGSPAEQFGGPAKEKNVADGLPRWVYIGGCWEQKRKFQGNPVELKHTKPALEQHSDIVLKTNRDQS